MNIHGEILLLRKRTLRDRAGEEREIRAAEGGKALLGDFNPVARKIT